MLNAELPRKKLARATLAALFGALLIVAGGIGAALAADDSEEDNLPDAKFFRGLMKQLGLKGQGDEIEYRERSPLVVPPSRDLPPPESEAATKTVPAWPVDQETKKQKEVAVKKKRSIQKTASDRFEDEGKPLPPDQLGPRGPTTGSTPTAASTPAGTPRDSRVADGGAMSPAELGNKGFFASITSFFKKDDDAPKPFVAEPPRESLTEPPAGYRTPSPNQPYGLSKTVKSTKARDDFTVRGTE